VVHDHGRIGPVPLPRGLPSLDNHAPGAQYERSRRRWRPGQPAPRCPMVKVPPAAAADSNAASGCVCILRQQRDDSDTGYSA
jgi:hypothetical protein